MADNKSTQIFSLIDSIIREVDYARKEPEFSNEVEKRKRRNPDILKDDDDVLRCLARVIAFSQNAKSSLVENMLARGTFDDVFSSFRVTKVAELDPNTLKDSYWEQITVIRFPKKLNSIVGCAKSLLSIEAKHGSFMRLIHECGIPFRLNTETDIEQFWKGFDKLKQELEGAETPFFHNTTSLLHFLLHVGYDCVKPDLRLMRVAKEIGIVDSPTGERNRVQTVRFIQRYCVDRRVRPSIVDFYLLIYGGQDWASQFATHALGSFATI